MAYTREQLESWADLDLGGHVLLMGPPGVGKTHLAVATVKALAAKGRSGIATSATRWWCDMQAAYERLSKRLPSDSPLPEMAEADVFLLDDLRVIRSARYVDDLARLLLVRFEAGRTTIVTTNLTCDDLIAMDGAMASRLLSADTAIAVMEGPDYRRAGL